MKIYNTQGDVVIDIEVDDSSFRYEKLMGENILKINFSMSYHVEIPIGAYCIFDEVTYYMDKPVEIKKYHNRNLSYSAIFSNIDSRMNSYKFVNQIDGRITFSLCGKLHEHIDMLVQNMNNRDTEMGWNIGEYLTTEEQLINYDNDYCSEALNKIISKFECEYEIKNKIISTYKKIWHNESDPLTLCYGQGNGFVSGVMRKANDQKPPVSKLYVIGSKKNINATSYGSNELKLPSSQIIGFDGENFSDDQNYDQNNGKKYASSRDGKWIYRYDMPIASNLEDSYDCSEVYPSRIGKVSDVIVVDDNSNLYDFTDNSIPDTLDYNRYIISGEKMVVAFQTGMLAGREFEVRYTHNPTISGQQGKRFEIVPKDIDGEIMPNATFLPTINDKYIVLNCEMPQEYICDNVNKTGASWQMFKRAIKHLYSEENQKFTFIGELDGIWSKRVWNSISHKIKLGSVVKFKDYNFLPNGVLVRINGIKTYINDPHAPVIELSNSVSVKGYRERANELQHDINRRMYHGFSENRSAMKNVNKEIENAKNIRQPLINSETNTWLLWDATRLEYKDSKMPSKGENGIDGKSCSVKVVKDITMVKWGEPFGVVNEGTDNAAVLKFTLPLPPTHTQIQIKELKIKTDIDGSNKIFELFDAYILGTTRLYYNGLRQLKHVDYEELDDTHFEMLKTTPKEGDYLIIEAKKR